MLLRVSVANCNHLQGAASVEDLYVMLYRLSHISCKNTGVGKSRFTVVCIEKDMQVMIITIALLTFKNRASCI